jgi:hypothetical protein
MTTQDTAGGAGATTPEVDAIDLDTAADAAAAMARLDEEVAQADPDTAPADAADAEAAGGDQAEGQEAGQAEADGEAQTAEKPEEKPEEKPAESTEDEDEALPEEGKRWHPAAQRHIQKVLGEKKKLKAELAAERQALDEMQQLARSVDLDPRSLPSFVATVGKALIRGDADAVARVVARLQELGHALPSEQAGSAGYSEEDLAAAVKAAAEAAVEDLDPEAAIAKALSAVRARKHPQGETAPPGSGGGGAAGGAAAAQSAGAKPAASTADLSQVRERIQGLVAQVHQTHGADGPRIAEAMRQAIADGKLPSQPEDWPLALELVRDAAAARISAEKAKQQARKPPPPSPTSQRTRADAPGDPFSRLDAEVGVR